MIEHKFIETNLNKRYPFLCIWSYSFLITFKYTIHIYVRFYLINFDTHFFSFSNYHMTIFSSFSLFYFVIIIIIILIINIINFFISVICTFFFVSLLNYMTLISFLLVSHSHTIVILFFQYRFLFLCFTDEWYNCFKNCDTLFDGSQVGFDPSAHLTK